MSFNVIYSYPTILELRKCISMIICPIIIDNLLSNYDIRMRYINISRELHEPSQLVYFASFSRQRIYHSHQTIDF